MRKLYLPVLLGVLMVAALFGLFQVARGQGPVRPDGSQVLASETVGDATREILAPAGQTAPEAPNLSFIDSPTATCYLPDAAKDECYINWYYQSVSASPNYIITMTTAINQIGIVARGSGFFQTSMYIPYNMLGDGFKVACGALGSGGNPKLGAAYAYTIRARDSARSKFGELWHGVLPGL